MYFQNYTLTHKVPFTIYADFETFVVSIDTSIPDPKTPHTTKTAKHILSGIFYVIINSGGEPINLYVVYSSPDVINTFLNY